MFVPPNSVVRFTTSLSSVLRLSCGAWRQDPSQKETKWMKHRRCTAGVEQLHGLDLTPLSSSLGGGRMQGACLVKVLGKMLVLTGTTPGPALFHPSTDFSTVTTARLFPLGDRSQWVYEERHGLLALLSPQVRAYTVTDTRGAHHFTPCCK